MTKSWCERQAITFLHTLERGLLDQYTDYWVGIAPSDCYEYYLRWVFAYTSIHFTWQANVRAYHAIAALPLNAPLSHVVKALENARTGCHRQRGFVIWEFRNRFWGNPYDWYPRKNETMPEFRTRLSKTARGIGLAKTSFLLEMTFPADCSVVCLDTHMLQLYNYDQKTRGAPTYREYREIEDHWVGTCRDLKISSPMARHIFFDKKQNATNTRYWSYVLEKYQRRPDGSSIVTASPPRQIRHFNSRSPNATDNKNGSTSTEAREGVCERGAFLGIDPALLFRTGVPVRAAGSRRQTVGRRSVPVPSRS